MGLKTKIASLWPPCMIHNFIRTTTSHDPEEDNVEEDHDEGTTTQVIEDCIESVESTVEWTNWRDMMAQEMYNEWRSLR